MGDLITLSGTVSEYRSASYPNYLYLTELIYPANITVLSSNNAVTPLVLGKDRSPPTEKLSALDVGKQGWLSVPNNVSLVEAVNATLQPNLYGLDFWESLEGTPCLLVDTSHRTKPMLQACLSRSPVQRPSISRRATASSGSMVTGK